MTGPQGPDRRIPGSPGGTGIVAVGLLSLALAGCLGGIGPTGTGEGGLVEDPTWTTGDWWRYRVEGTLPADWMENPFPRTDRIDHRPSVSLNVTATMVAYPASVHFGHVRTWGVASDSPRAIFASNNFDLPIVDGRWDLAYGEWVNTTLWDWPLVDGKTWTTSYANATLEMTAERLDAGGRFEVTGRLADGTAVLQYTYDPAVRWFEVIRIRDSEGSTVLSVDLVASGSGYDEVAYIGGGFTVAVTADSSDTPTAGELRQGSRAWADVPTLFYRNLLFESNSSGGLAALREGPEDNVPEMRFREVCPCDLDRTWLREPDQGPGMYDWQIDYAASGSSRFAYVAQTECFSVMTFAGEEPTIQEECPLADPGDSDGRQARQLIELSPP